MAPPEQLFQGEQLHCDDLVNIQRMTELGMPIGQCVIDEQTYDIMVPMPEPTQVGGGPLPTPESTYSVAVEPETIPLSPESAEKYTDIQLVIAILLSVGATTILITGLPALLQRYRKRARARR